MLVAGAYAVHWQRPVLHHAAQVPRDGTSSDLAFSGKLAFAGAYDGFRIFDLAQPTQPRLVADVRCRGAQGDVSIARAGTRLLLFISVDRPQTSSACSSVDTEVVASAAGGERFFVPGFEGIRVFDVTVPAEPRQIAAVATACGSHTHSTISDPKRGRTLIYVSSYPLGSHRTPPGYPDFQGPRCETPHAKISIVTVPSERPEDARVLKEQPLDSRTAPYEPQLGYRIVGCHDVQFFVRRTRKLAAAACMSEGQLWDVSDPANPRTVGPITRIRNPSVEFWHSAAFTWDGKVVLFGDEALRGSPHCARSSRSGDVWFYRAVRPGARTKLLGRYAIPREQAAYCSIHLFNVVPLRGRRYIAVASAYGAGTSVFDFTNPARPRELAFFDAPNANTWSTYWYNGLAVANDISRGLDVFRLTDAQGRPLGSRRLAAMNPQTQLVP